MYEKVEAQPFKWVEESNEPMRSSGRKRKRPERKEFVRWGSKQLISFLESIGKSTEEQISQYEVTSIISQYINDNKLIDPTKKKKRFVCDAKLQTIFPRKINMMIKIFELLEPHYAENDLSTDSEGYSSDEREEKKPKPQKDPTSEEDAHKRKKASEALKSCFAAIIPENIKAVYLKKTLVQELLKAPDSFESKVFGSFVRVKADRYDYRQKNSHVLQLVTGIKKAAAADDNVRLAISDMEKLINISELSDVDFSEEECKDLHRRIQEGSLKHPIVAELQEKVQVLHEDITKHWLPRELTRLECLIDRANEKGWRGELFQYRSKRKLLETPAEQSRLLQTVPEVIAEELKPDPVPENTEYSPKKASTDAVSVTDWVISSDPLTIGGTTTSGGASPKAQEPEPPNIEEQTNIQLQSPRVEVEHPVEKPSCQAVENGHLSFDLNEMNNGVGSCLKHPVEKPLCQAVENGHLSFDLNEMNNGVGSFLKQSEAVDLNQSAKQIEVIDLSDDEEDENAPGPQVQIQTLTEVVWHYIDPVMKEQGPFSLTQLKIWSDQGFFNTGFTVWKSGQSQDQQVLLTELLSKMFPK